MLRHYVVEVKFIDVDHEVLGAWGQDDAVPMQFWGGDTRFWGGDWYVKGDFVSLHSKSHSVSIFLLRPNVADDAEICDLGVLGDFLPVDEKTSVSSLYVPKPLESSLNFIWHALTTFDFLGPLTRCQYSLYFPVLGQITLLSLPCSNFRLLVTWYITVDSFPPLGAWSVLACEVCRVGCLLLPHGLTWCLVLGYALPVRYTGAVLVPCGFLLPFDVMRKALVWGHSIPTRNHTKKNTPTCSTHNLRWHQTNAFRITSKGSRNPQGTKTAPV